MKLGRALVDGVKRTVLVMEDEVDLLPQDAPSPDVAVRSRDALARIKEVSGSAERVALADVHLIAPLERFDRDVLCTGWNYWTHFEESAGKREGQEPEARPTKPTFFTKAPLALIGPYAPIAHDVQVSAKWDYEAELAIVIGKGGRSIPEDKAMDHVFGMMVANDVSQRDIQRVHGGQWFRGKSVDRSTPIGPWITTADGIEDVQALEISCVLNGETMQLASTGQMAFSIAQLIAELSWGLTLQPGDLILTGTPAGIGNAREPQVFLTPGDELVTSVTGLGELRNVVQEADLSSYWVPSDEN